MRLLLDESVPRRLRNALTTSFKFSCLSCRNWRRLSQPYSQERLCRSGHNQASRSIVVEYRCGLGKSASTVELAVELAKLDLDALVVPGPISAAAAKRTSGRTPIVFAASGVDPVGMGLVASLARPGGNVTGIAMMATELAEKRLELMTDTVPGLSRIGVLIPPADPSVIDRC